MTEKQFLHWIADRLVHVYGESENVDFVLKLRKIADDVGEATALLEALKRMLGEAGDQLKGINAKLEGKK